MRTEAPAGERVKTGLATYYDDNYGACLQTYATQTFLEKCLGHECSLIAYNRRRCEKTFLQRVRIALASSPAAVWAKRNLLGRAPSDPAEIFRARHASLFRARHRAFERFRRGYLKLDQCRTYTRFADYMKKPPLYDVYLCGSDQLWNPLFFNGCNPIYTLAFAPEGKPRISYSTSIGLDEIPERYRAEMAGALGKFTAISVRETRGAEIVKELTGREAQVTVDPTFLLEASDWRKVCAEAPAPVPAEPYILFYLWGDLDYISEFKEYIKTKTGLTGAALPYRLAEMEGNDKKIYNAGPLDFANLIDRAALVVTDSFHATALSINLRTPFYSLLRCGASSKVNMNSRIYSILGKLGLESRLVQPGAPFPEPALDVDWTEAGTKITRWRQESIDWLTSALRR